MIAWREQKSAFVGSFTFQDGGKAQAVLVGPRDNPKGAVVVSLKDSGDPPDSVPLAEVLSRIHPSDCIEIICMQERAFGLSALLSPTL